MDLDGDGRRDVVSGSWPGAVYWFRGLEGGAFDAPKKLTHPDGSEIQEGKASSVAVADWDGDGDLDLIVGNFQGSVVLVPNEGSAKQPKWGQSRKILVGGKPAHVDGDAGPCVADWDGDGVPDLLVGSGEGAVTWYRNLSKQGEAQLAAPQTLIGSDPRNEDRKIEAVRPGSRTKVCVADWNGDGRKDLLIGDVTWRTLDAPVPTPEEKKQLAAAEEEYRALDQKEWALREDMDGKIREEKGWAKNRKLTDVEDDWLFDETFRRLDGVEAYRKIQEEKEKPLAVMEKFEAPTETHGYVWLALRKAATSASVSGK